MEIDFETLFTDNASTLEIYLCPVNSGGSDVQVGWPASHHWNLRFTAPTTYTEFRINDIVCSYEGTNDAQKVTRRVMTKHFRAANLFIATFVEEQIPAFAFPVTKDLQSVVEVTRKIMRVNNRMHIVCDIENTQVQYLYIKYNHNTNVDVAKIKGDLNVALQKLAEVST